jgi:two-component system, LytTR family, response regulator
MIRAVIIDDEPNNIEMLELLLQKHCKNVDVSGAAVSAKEGLVLINNVSPDLVFLDIQMPQQTGFDMLRQFGRYDFEIVFVTAYDQYGIQAVKFSAIDYLLKPVQVEDLKSAVEKVQKKIDQKKDNLLLANLLEYLKNKENKNDHKLALATSKETLFISPDKIVRCESSNAYTVFFFNDRQKLTVSRPIYEFEELLADYGFIRCHQSHLVNKKYIKSWRKEDGGSLILEDTSVIPISRSKKDIVFETLIAAKK